MRSLEPKIHELKIKPEYFTKVKQGKKKAEIRFDDRDYMIGDTLILKEWRTRKGVFTGREIRSRVTDITRLIYVIPGIHHEWVVLHMEIEQ